MKRPASLYFISDTARSYVKIGISKNPECRLFDLQAGCPIELQLDLVLEFDGPGACRLEDSLHQHFAGHWLRREWFTYADPLKEYVRAWHDGERPTVPTPLYPCAQATGEHGERLTKSEFMARLRSIAE